MPVPLGARPVGVIEEGDRVLAVIARRGAELIQDRGLRPAEGERIARAHNTDVLTSGGRGHRGLRGDRLGENAR